MTEVVSIQFRGRGKTYYFDPNGLAPADEQPVIVETAKGLEYGICVRGVHAVADETVVQPLRPLIRIATDADKALFEANLEKEKKAFDICTERIAAHGLDMKLVDVECCFDGSKTLFFFTADGRVDFRELVKDLASIFHNRIELRQIGVRDEAKMLGGIGICGRPYCCHTFLSDFAPVSTKMAKIQNLSLNPAKISGSCGRLMCCLRYEEEAYEDLVKKVPKQGAFVETTEGYGNVVSVDLLRQTVKVHLEGESDDAIHQFKAEEVATVPGGHPKEGEPYPKVLNYVPTEEEPVEEEDPWALPLLFAEEQKEEPVAPQEEQQSDSAPADHQARRHRQNRRPNGRKNGKKPAAQPEKQTETKAETGKKSAEENHVHSASGNHKKDRKPNHNTSGNRNNEHSSPKAENKEGKDSASSGGRKEKQGKPAPQTADGAHPAGSSPEKKKNNHRRYYHRGKKPLGGSSNPPA